jgi:hypothetical protein
LPPVRGHADRDGDNPERHQSAGRAFKPFNLDGDDNESEDDTAAENQQGNLRVTHWALIAPFSRYALVTAEPAISLVAQKGTAERRFNSRRRLAAREGHQPASLKSRAFCERQASRRILDVLLRVIPLVQELAAVPALALASARQVCTGSARSPR